MEADSPRGSNENLLLAHRGWYPCQSNWWHWDMAQGKYGPNIQIFIKSCLEILQTPNVVNHYCLACHFNINIYIYIYIVHLENLAAFFTQFYTEFYLKMTYETKSQSCSVIKHIITKQETKRQISKFCAEHIFKTYSTYHANYPWFVYQYHW